MQFWLGPAKASRPSPGFARDCCVGYCIGDGGAMQREGQGMWAGGAGPVDDDKTKAERLVEQATNRHNGDPGMVGTMVKVRVGILAVVVMSAVLGGCVSKRPEPPVVTPVWKPVQPRVVIEPSEPTPTQPQVQDAGKSLWHIELRRIDGAVIVVDPGHGGKDPGTLGGGYADVPEKTVVLAIGRAVAARLEELGATVRLTRSRDSFVGLDDRAAIAEQTKADLFVSIHVDAAANNSASGATVYIAQGASRASERAGARIEQAIKRWGMRSRGVRRARYRVLVGHSRPAVLVECGYLTNATDARRLGASWYQERVAQALVEGIVRYFREG